MCSAPEAGNPAIVALPATFSSVLDLIWSRIRAGRAAAAG
jgi:hypothetical protein